MIALATAMLIGVAWLIFGGSVAAGVGLGLALATAIDQLITNP